MSDADKIRAVSNQELQEKIDDANRKIQALNNVVHSLSMQQTDLYKLISEHKSHHASELQAASAENRLLMDQMQESRTTLRTMSDVFDTVIRTNNKILDSAKNTFENRDKLTSAEIKDLIVDILGLKELTRDEYNYRFGKKDKKTKDKRTKTNETHS
jgi:DNA anti-recombination protein RmuC